jgi:hypothetical protein
MAKKDVTPDPTTGEYKIAGKDGRNLFLKFVTPSDKDNHIVEELTGDDVEDKLPTPRPTWNGKPINWFANYSVYRAKVENGKKVKTGENDYASVPYTISLEVVSDTTYLVFHGRALHDVTDQIKRGPVTLTAGDPPWGQSP